ncbi:uncharacterized protein LTR77_010479 [Saxophila tyrrhenica]|uniref:Enoyl-CoA hydratase n=1 Tax=Saxophila tyrrhenica TaxID=1690608 RepID=A0AAV9NVJ3_9PEZI|nr:hypothetical protein LTR77_010479 [Saxophila tyrrhenica]
MAPPQLDTVLTEMDGSIGIIRFNRPKNANALSTQLMKDVLAALQWATNEADVRVIVFTGVGRFYTSGMDLVGVPSDGPVLSDEAIDTLSDLASSIHETLIKTSKTTIAAVNGPAAGWGTSSIALFDLVYSVPDAIFFTPFVKWGLCAEGCSSVTFMKIMGRQKAASLILAGERMTPQELESAGLISKILPKENFFEDVMKIARRVVAQPPGALKFSKELMMAPIRDELLAANQRECAGLAERGRTDEPRQAIAAFEVEQKARRKAKL